MKLSVSLSRRGSDRLGELVRETGTNPSVILELALDQIYDALPAEERAARAKRMLEDRRPRTRTGWRKLFWEMLADEIGAVDPARGDIRMLMAARSYLGFNVMHDARHDLAGGDDSIIIVFAETAPPCAPDTVRIGTAWTFRVGQPISEAAHTVAAWLRDNAPKLTPDLSKA
jgi:hypothetical protein